MEQMYNFIFKQISQDTLIHHYNNLSIWAEARMVHLYPRFHSVIRECESMSIYNIKT